MQDNDDGVPDVELELGDVDPDAWLWLPGVDYLAGWREARAEAERLNGALAGSGIGRAELRAVAGTLADGSGVLRLLGTPDGARKLSEILEEIIRWRGAA